MLKDCPFCHSDDVELVTSNNETPIYVKCNTCQVEGPLVGNVVELWNNR